MIGHIIFGDYPPSLVSTFICLVVGFLIFTIACYVVAKKSYNTEMSIGIVLVSFAIGGTIASSPLYQSGLFFECRFIADSMVYQESNYNIIGKECRHRENLAEEWSKWALVTISEIRTEENRNGD